MTSTTMHDFSYFKLIEINRNRYSESKDNAAKCFRAQAPAPGERPFDLEMGRSAVTSERAIKGSDARPGPRG